MDVSLHDMNVIIDKNSHLPRYYQLKEIIKDDIATRNIRKGSRIETVRGLMAKYNVSCDTVRRAISELIREGILISDKGKGLFVRKAAKRDVSINIAYMVSEDVPQLFQNPFHADVLWGVREESAKLRYNLSLSSFWLKKRLLPKIINEHKINAVIIAGMVEAKFLDKIRQNNLPVVLVDYRPQVGDFDYIISDYEGGMSELAEYLIERGYNTITYIDVNLPHILIPERLKGYKKAMSKADLQPDIVSIRDFAYEEGVRIGQVILKRQELPKAVIGFNDNVAIGVMKAITSSGLKIPQDIAVAGFDDFPIASQITPVLTTVRVNRKEMGIVAVKLLHRRIKEGLQKVAEEVVIPVELIVREST